MFFKEGWHPVCGLHHHFSGSISFELSSLELQEYSEEEIDHDGIFAAWHFLRTVDIPAVLISSGEIIYVDRAILFNFGDTWSTCNSHFDLEYGTLGTGFGQRMNGERSRQPKRMTRDEATRRYGPFAFSPVLVPRDAFQRFDRQHQDNIRLRAGRPPERRHETSVVEMIFDAVDSDKARRRDDIKALVAPDMKHEEWRLHWREATRQRPSLRKPGPKP